MDYQVTFNTLKEHETINIPYGFDCAIWYCYKRFKKYVVRESIVRGIWATNIVGITLDNNWKIPCDEFDRLFDDKNKAIDWCLKQNQRNTVKVIPYRW